MYPSVLFGTAFLQYQLTHIMALHVVQGIEKESNFLSFFSEIRTEMKHIATIRVKTIIIATVPRILSLPLIMLKEALKTLFSIAFHELKRIMMCFSKDVISRQADGSVSFSDGGLHVHSHPPKLLQILKYERKILLINGK